MHGRLCPAQCLYLASLSKCFDTWERSESTQTSPLRQVYSDQLSLLSVPVVIKSLTDLISGGPGELQDLHYDVTVARLLSILSVLDQFGVLGITHTGDGLVLICQLLLNLLNETVDKLINSILVLSIQKKIKDVILGWHLSVVSLWILIVILIIVFLLEVVLLLVQVLCQLDLELVNLGTDIREKLALVS